MSGYGYMPQENPNSYGQPPSSAQNLQFYSSSYTAQPVSGHSTPFQASGYPGQQSYGQQSGFGGGSSAAGFGGFGAGTGAPGVSGRMGEQGGLRTGWVAAFTAEGYDGEPPLLEELGVNFGHIKMKVCRPSMGFTSCFVPKEGMAVCLGSDGVRGCCPAGQADIGHQEIRRANRVFCADAHGLESSRWNRPAYNGRLRPSGTRAILLAIRILSTIRKFQSTESQTRSTTAQPMVCLQPDELTKPSRTQSGKVHFGYIYGLALLGSTSLHFIISLMSPPLDPNAHVHAHPVTPGAPPTSMSGGGHFSSTLTMSRSASVLGYCLLPLVLTSLVGVGVPMDTAFGYALTTAAIVWCTTSSSAMFCAVGRMQGMRGLVAYPLALFYVGFGIMSIFSSRGTGALGKGVGGAGVGNTMAGAAGAAGAGKGS